MDKNVFAKKAWMEYAVKNIVLVTIDFPRDKKIVPENFVQRNKKLAKEFGVAGYPTYILMDGDGKTRIGKLGAGRGKTPKSFIGEINTLMKGKSK